jgi:hypothetical protein
MGDLVYAADTWKSWSSLSEGERKLRAAKAIQQKDHHDLQQGDMDNLWLMVLAYLQFKGRICQCLDSMLKYCPSMKLELF